VHFHVRVVDGCLRKYRRGVDRDGEPAAPSIIFHKASAIDETAVAQVQPTLPRRILRAFVGRRLLESFEANEMLAYWHSGFLVDSSVRSGWRGL
jgi:hypothetical protein